MGGPIVLTYGDLSEPRRCELHGGMATRFGTLIDPNGHKWIICAECINSLWSERQQLNAEAIDKEKEQQYIDRAMERLRDMLFEERG